MLNQDLLDCLSQWDTPTICNALELVVPERRGHGFSVHPFSVMYPEAKPMVGYARTAKIRASHPVNSNAECVDRLDYYEYIASGASPTIVVIEDVDPQPGVGAYWGEVHTAVHKALGALGVITNGSYRDIADNAPGFQILGGMVGPSHAYVHPISVNTNVTVHGMAVSHDDLIHADRHGAVVVPSAVAEKIPEAVAQIADREAKVLSVARSDNFSMDKLKQALGGTSEAH
ncbi:MAG: RraA family protein [Gammaproteobacteria bacterium]|nr:RraA family protein [Gammaproteobacteria bacterium]